MENYSKNTRAVSVGSRARWNPKQNCLQINFSKKQLLSLEYSKPDKQNVYDINLFQKFSVSK